MVNNKQTNHRVYLWRYGSEVISDHFWLGTGTGAADDALYEELKQCTAQFWNGERTYLLSEKKYNYHNEYLQHWAAHGLIGLLMLLGLMLVPLIYFGRKLNALQLSFLVLTAIAWLTESMLERQAGVLFFSFFYALLFVAAADVSTKTGKTTA
jgi:O-antigen ligase